MTGRGVGEEELIVKRLSEGLDRQVAWRSNEGSADGLAAVP
jgi:hypothetical protein